MKREYTKPAMMVYRLRTQAPLLAGSPLPESDEETVEQW
jgi:hypothetical protein